MVQAWEEEKPLTWSAADISEFAKQKMVDFMDPDWVVVDVHK